MEIIFGRENAEMLRERFTVLDLETVTDKEGNSMEVFCLIPADKIKLSDLPTLADWVKLHNEFLHGYQTKQYNYCRQALEHLMGKFGGEVDSFYSIILERITAEEKIST
jgi:hypothetical protein